MNGEVDSAGRALAVVNGRPSEHSHPTAVTAWIDTAFTGELVMPRATVE